VIRRLSLPDLQMFFKPLKILNSVRNETWSPTPGRHLLSTCLPVHAAQHLVNVGLQAYHTFSTHLTSSIPWIGIILRSVSRTPELQLDSHVYVKIGNVNNHKRCPSEFAFHHEFRTSRLILVCSFSRQT
jgi:hypothetical protein